MGHFSLFQGDRRRGVVKQFGSRFLLRKALLLGCRAQLGNVQRKRQVENRRLGSIWRICRLGIGFWCGFRLGFLLRFFLGFLLIFLILPVGCTCLREHCNSCVAKVPNIVEGDAHRRVVWWHNRLEGRTDTVTKRGKLLWVDGGRGAGNDLERGQRFAGFRHPPAESGQPIAQRKIQGYSRAGERRAHDLDRDP